MECHHGGGILNINVQLMITNVLSRPIFFKSKYI